MTEVLTSAQMRAVERAAIDAGKVGGLELMERAGQGVVAAILAEWPELAVGEHRALVLCGPGNNGGDGFVVARLLAARGWEVAVWLYGEAARLPPDARVNHDRWRELGAVGQFPAEDPAFAPELYEWAEQDRARPLHVIDALFGIGLDRPLSSNEVEDLAMLHVSLDDLWLDCGGPVTRMVAVDIPSGLCADSGRILLCEAAEDLDEVDRDPRFYCFCAALTVTFHRAQPGHLLASGPQLCGRLVVADIGLGSQPDLLKRHLSQVGPPFWGLAKSSRAHKFSHGHALVLAGPPAAGGAARLAAHAALRIGAGLVTVAAAPAALAENAARLDAVMLREVVDAGALDQMLQDPRINALCLGPGLGLGAREAALVATALRQAPKRRLVLDADALTLIARDPALFDGLHGGCVLTPHDGEFARLFPDIAARLAAPATRGPAYSKVDATRDAAARAGCTVLFKGPDTVIATPDGHCAINAAAYDRAAPWLATAGAGDVLAGFITGLLARGFAPFDAACAATWLHVECARSFGPGLIAEDLPKELPRVFRALGLS